MAHDVSPLAPATLAKLPPVPGVRMAVTNSGTRYKGRPDLLLMAFPAGTTVAGLLTQSSMPGAPVEWLRKVLPAGTSIAALVGCVAFSSRVRKIGGNPV